MHIARWLAPAIALLAVAFAWADGGLYSGTAHGNATTGVQRDTALPQGSCVQCHSAHGDAPQSFGLWVANDNNLCFTCHVNNKQTYPGQTTYQMNAHVTSTATMDGRPVGYCVQCHNPHAAGDQQGAFPHLTSHLTTQTCFTCHGTGNRPQNAADIQSHTQKAYAHQLDGSDRLHDDWAEVNSVPVNPNPLLSGVKRHVNCGDCHNPHSGRSTPRQQGVSTIGEMLLGTWGVRPVYPAIAWTAPTGYVVEQFTNTTRPEADLCLKCHSTWSWENTAPLTANGTRQTDQAIEFNPSNPAYHNVTGQPEANVPTEDVVFGTMNPPDYVNGWGPNAAMACTDCHGSDASQSNARGPHGSIFDFLLKKRFKAEAAALDNTGAAGTQNDLCFDCHAWNTYGAGGTGMNSNFSAATVNLHTTANHAQNGCGACHTAVPHGFKRQHLIVYTTDGAPYFNGGVNGIDAYTPANGGAYTKENCTTTCHGVQAPMLRLAPLSNPPRRR